MDEAAPRRGRFASVDTFRGAVLALMLFTPATGAAGYPWLRHAAWDGLTASDWLFPTFLVTSGLSLSFLLRDGATRATYARLIRRLVLLVAAGLVYNAYGASWFDLSELRFTGVLQMIGIAGACGAVVVLAGRAMLGEDKIWWIVGTATVLALLYGLGLDLIACEPAGRCSPYLSVDTGVLGASHVYRGGGAGWDPEGLVTSIASASLVLYGYAAGVLLRRHGRSSPAATLANIGALAGLCFVGGLVASQWMPSNKRLLTPAFVLLAAGTALAVFCVMYLLADSAKALRANHSDQADRAHHGDQADRADHGDQAEPRREPRLLRPWRLPWRQWTWPFVAFGRNALIVFGAERFLLQTARYVHIGDRSIQDRLLEDILPFGEPGVHLAYTALLLLAVFAVVGHLHRHRLYLAL
ncbi:MAG: heparan-alpha-glucosaminide N-acetyltransferase domain-containing protein [Acidimicrobiaceae bacterium]|nr:heparan-alpha-glucosaminide N-acetyltransferase domain-containing protein [Acidimicrobiaceae bacterium]